MRADARKGTTRRARNEDGVVGCPDLGVTAKETRYSEKKEMKGKKDNLGTSIYRVQTRSQAIELAQEFQKENRYDLFRGQSRDWKVVTSFTRLNRTKRETALAKMGRFFYWVETTAGLEYLWNQTDQIIAVAQHYGIPTNFLDFTSDPLVAGYFATQHRQSISDDNPGCIICLNSVEFLRVFGVFGRISHLPEILRLEVPDLWRIEAQKSVFIYCPYDNIEDIYPFDRILFSELDSNDELQKDVFFPADKSFLEQLIDQFFCREVLVRFDENIRRLQQKCKKVVVTRLSSSWHNCERSFLTRPFVPKHWSWQKGKRQSWLSSPEEHTKPRTSQWIQLSADPEVGIDEIIKEITSQIAETFCRQSYSAKQDVFWKFEPTKHIRRSRSLVAVTNEVLRYVWNGLRNLPVSLDDLEMALAMGVAYSCVCHRTNVLKTRLPYSDYPRIYPDAFWVEMGGLDGSYSHGQVRNRSLRICIRKDIGKYLAPKWRHYQDQPSSLIQIVRDPQRLFNLQKFTSVFVREIVPTQVVCRVLNLDGSPYFSPYRIQVFGLS